MCDPTVPRPSLKRLMAVLLPLLVLVGLVIATGHIEKPTDFTDAGGSTTSAADAFDFPDVYNENTSSTTTDPNADPSITWHTWDTGASVYEELSLTVTLNATDFSTNTWALYYDNSTDTTCDSTDRVLKASGSDTFATDNLSASLPADQDLTDIQVCISGAVTVVGEGGTVNVFDIRTNGTVDTTPPRWRNQQQNDSSPAAGDAVELAAQGRDNGTLDHAILATNDSGTWENETAYGSPLRLATSETWTWSNFTWSNASVDPGTTVAWRIHYNDTAGNYNTTDTLTFTVEDAVLNVTLHDPPSPFTIGQNATFTLNATVSCRNADCGEVNGTGRYNGSSASPDTTIPASGTPFTTQDDNPQTCDTSLLRGESCEVSWTVNATGDIGSTWLLDVEATSDVAATNDSSDAEVEIASRIIDLRLRWDTTDFGRVFPGSDDVPAQNNSDDLYNVSVTDRSTLDVDLWINGSDLLQEDGDRRIGVGNVSWNTADDPSGATALEPTFSRLRSSVSPGTNTTTYFWLDAPNGVPADNYTGTIMVKANASG